MQQGFSENTFKSIKSNDVSGHLRWTPICPGMSFIIKKRRSTPPRSSITPSLIMYQRGGVPPLLGYIINVPKGGCQPPFYGTFDGPDLPPFGTFLPAFGPEKNVLVGEEV